MTDRAPPPTPPASGRGEVEPLLAERLARAITLGGPIPVSQFMGAANAHYYATRDPLGAAGDFTTAPEISQMFGELGPGRGTLTADALRVMARAGLTPPVHFIETSPTLRTAQGSRVPDATWHDTLATLPDDVPLIVVANEFFDALPIRQLVRRGAQWHERLVACQDLLFLPVAGPVVPADIIPPHLSDAPAGSIIETSPASVAIMADLSARIVAQGGAALVVDYGYDGPAVGDTLQAVRAHGFANPFETPGEQDLTAHVDMATLALVAQASGAVVSGATGQGAFLTALGIDARAAALGERVAADRARLVEEMGTLFRVLAIRHADWPLPAGFA